MVKKQKLLLYCNKSAGHQYQNSLSGFLHDEELNVKSCKITVLVMQKKKKELVPEGSGAAPLDGQSDVRKDGGTWRSRISRLLLILIS